MIFTGTKSEFIRDAQSYTHEQVEGRKPKINHLTEVIEHLASAFMDRDSTWTVEFLILDEGVSFSVAKVTP